jgi:catechol 2,3-dioxygenase-like lactoylglutathione lyase family enzyme
MRGGLSRAEGHTGERPDAGCAYDPLPAAGDRYFGQAYDALPAAPGSTGASGSVHTAISVIPSRTQPAAETSNMSTVSVRYIVTDIAAALDFYTTKLGFRTQMHPNELFAMLTRDDLRLVLVKPVGLDGPSGGGSAMPDGTMQHPGGWNRFSVEVADLAGIVAGLRKSGVRFRNDIVVGVGGKQVIVEDPSGNPVELFEPILPQARLSSSS